MEALYTIIVLVFIILAPLLLEINWACLFGFHKFVYVGKKHGMCRNKGTGGLVGSSRYMYKCHLCNKDKPIEEKDYE